MKARKRALRCAMCLRRSGEVRLLLQGKSGSCICDVCVLLAMHGLVERFSEAKS